MDGSPAASTTSDVEMELPNGRGHGDLGSRRGTNFTPRAGEMILEVEGTRLWGPPRKRVPKCLKGPKTTYTTIELAEKQSKRSTKGPFSLYIGSPWSHPGNGICGARRERPSRPPPVLRPCSHLHIREITKYSSVEECFKGTVPA